MLNDRPHPEGVIVRWLDVVPQGSGQNSVKPCLRWA
jgi:hypothetical protein